MPIDGENGKPETKSLATEIVEQLKAEDTDKQLIAVEVARQLKPVMDSIGDIKSWMLGLWSNGSKQPEGYLQRARAEDRRHIADLLSNQQDLSRRVQVVEGYVDAQKIIRAERERTDLTKAAEIKNTLEVANIKVNRRISMQNLLIATASLCVALFMAVMAYKVYALQAQLPAPVHHTSTGP